MKFYLKRVCSCFYNSKEITIGIPEVNANCVTARSSSKNLELLKNLLRNGIEESEIRKYKIYKEIYLKNLLSVKKTKSNENRNSLFLEYLVTRNVLSRDCLDTLTQKKVLIIGAGALGSIICTQLAQFTIRDICIIDDDKISNSDPVRISIYPRHANGLYKVDFLKKYLKKNFEVDLLAINQKANGKLLNRIYATFKPDLLIKVTDANQKFNLAIDKFCSAKKLPYFNCAYSYERAKIGPLFIPGKTFTYKIISDFIDQSRYREISPFKTDKLYPGYFKHPSVNFIINTTAGMATKEILFFLLGQNNLVHTEGKEMTFNFLTNSLEYNDFKFLEKIQDEKKSD